MLKGSQPEELTINTPKLVHPKTYTLPSEKEPPLQTEAELMMSFGVALRNRATPRPPLIRILLTELGGLQGRPDLVDARIRALPASVSVHALATSLSSPTKARLLATLRYGAPRSRTYLARVTGLSARPLGNHIRQLEKAGLIKVGKNAAISLNCPLPWNMINIIAYEGKLSNWRRALHQATSYRSFSHSVRVVIPDSGATHAKTLTTLFRATGIGLISVNKDGRTRIAIRSRKRRPASRRLYLMAVGVILSNFLEERRRLHRTLRPETIQPI